MPKIYTKTGDTGETSLFGAGRVKKDHLRVRAYGEIDELNSLIGLVRAGLQYEEIVKELGPVLARIQDRLFVIGSVLATPKNAALYEKIPKMIEEDIILLEVAIDKLARQMPRLQNFILPSGSILATQLHIARAVCRRAERTTVTLSKEVEIDPLLIQYTNRLSDLLFEAARWVNWKLGIEEEEWK